MPENQEPENRDINVRDGNYIESLGGNYVQGNFFQNIINSLGGQSIAPVGNLQRERNQRILLAEVKQEVTARLKQSLHQAVLINLSKELQPQQVKRIWDAEIKIGEQLIEAISNTTTILEVFEQEEIAGKLLILGAPGSGKTTTQLELAQALITRAEEQQDYPIPVLLNLSSWRDENQSMADWLIAELKSKYGVSVKLGKEWVANRVILPLLDGLDEVKLILQKSCLQRINQFLEGEHRPQYIVICSRIEEYKNHQNKLLLNGAIYLKSLTNSQIHDYLIKVNHADFWQTINADPDLLELVKTPLLLSITILASQEIYSEQWQQLVYASDHLQHLLDAYVRRMLTRPIESRVYIKRYPPTLRRTRIWLIVLAKMLQTELQTEFLIEKMQPSWLRNSSQRWMYILSVMLLVVLIFTLNLGLSFVLFCLYFLSLTFRWSELIFDPFFVLSDLIISWAYSPFFPNIFPPNHSLDYIIFYLIVKVTFLWQISSLIFAVIFGFYCGNNSKIITIEKFYFSCKKSRNKLSSVLLYWIILLWLIFGIIGSIFGLNIYASILISGLFMLFLSGLVIRDIEIKRIPNQGIWKTATNAFIFGFISLLVFLFSCQMNLRQATTIGLIVGLIFGLQGGGKSCIQHFILRLILYFNGYIPWNYARFLDYCTERMILQRVGGRYRFIHKMLQDHFAQMPDH